MEPSPTGPADTAMMGIVHSALRRDLDRTAVALASAPPPGPQQREAIAEHVGWMMHFLHSHHAGEDDGLWPLVRMTDPATGDLLDRMDADHARISPAIDTLSAAGRRYARDSSDEARVALATSLAELREVLDPHLRAEEDEAMPVVEKTLTHAQWEAFNQEYYIKPKSKKQLGQEGHWLIDSIDPAGYDVVVGNVPPVPRFVLLKVFAKPYARGCKARWGASVPIAPQPRG
jgi:hemerythrin-like domain-containing protein